MPGAPLGQPLGFPLGGNPDIVRKSELLRTDILFDGDKRIGAGGDYVLVTGDAALLQAVWHRFITEPGEYKRRPTYGCGGKSFLKKPDTPSNREELRRRTVDNLLQDDRIEQVTEVAITRAVVDGKHVHRVYIRFLSRGRTLTLERTLGA